MKENGVNDSVKVTMERKHKRRRVAPNPGERLCEKDMKETGE